MSDRDRRALMLWQLAELLRQYRRARVWWAVHNGYGPLP